jgi:hypothetical protein
MQFSFGNGLLRAAVSLGFLLGFLGCLVAQETLYSQAATSQPPNPVLAGSTYQGDALRFNGSDSMLTNQVEIGLPDDFGVALEDSVEMLRVDIQQCTFGIDQVVIGPKVASKAARIARPNISPPLLV